MIAFVEGKLDLYFFQSVLTGLKGWQDASVHNCEPVSDVYNFFKKSRNRMIVRHDNDYAMLVRCDGKINATDKFIEFINDSLRTDHQIEKILLIVDKDMAQKFEE